mmetsp:Transcript_50974/g.99934  ORF Transcript_50974/g.99934 Transcript_50974/m.99934 type:complete len:507 (-) Transcript_50974:82-1602(-)
MSRLEYSLIRAPFENLSQVSRNTQKIVAKDMGEILQLAKGLKVAQKSKNSADKVTQLVDSLKALKRKLKEAQQQSEKSTQSTRHRILHLKQLDGCYNEEREISVSEPMDVNGDSPNNAATAASTTSSASVEPLVSDNTASKIFTASNGTELKETKTQPAARASGYKQNNHAATQRAQLDRLYVDHLLRRGYYETAAELAATAGIIPLVDINLFSAAQKVLGGLNKKDCSTALAWCRANRSKLSRLGSSLEFELQVQRFVELVRVFPVAAAAVPTDVPNRSLLSSLISSSSPPSPPQPCTATATTSFVSSRPSQAELLSFLQTNLSSAASSSGNPNNLSRLYEVMGLMAFLNYQEEPEMAGATPWHKYTHLFSPARWEMLKQLFHSEFCTLHGLSQRSLLEIHLFAGLSSLKTPWCAKDSHPQCPVCYTPLTSIAEKLNVSHRQHSRLVCRISGEVMDENNPPIALPDGRVYSKKALFEIADKSRKFVCPISQQVFSLDECRSVYIL